MISLMNKRMRSDEGFTLIELMVVVLIIAILIAIAIPTFLGARKRAQRKQAQSSLRNVLTHEKTYYTDNQTYTTAATDLTAIDPAFTYTTGASSDPRTVSISVGNGNQTVALASWSKSSDCYSILDIATGAGAGTTYGKTETGNIAQATGCTADAAGAGGLSGGAANTGSSW